MDSLLEKIKASFKWKKTSEYCADKLDITIDDYEKLRDYVKSRELLENSSTSYEYNLEKGEAKMEAISSSEPKSPEEIIDILEQDLSGYNKIIVI